MTNFVTMLLRFERGLPDEILHQLTNNLGALPRLLVFLIINWSMRGGSERAFQRKWNEGPVVLECQDDFILFYNYNWFLLCVLFEVLNEKVNDASPKVDNGKII